MRKENGHYQSERWVNYCYGVILIDNVMQDVSFFIDHNNKKKSLQKSIHNNAEKKLFIEKQTNILLRFLDVRKSV